MKKKKEKSRRKNFTRLKRKQNKKNHFYNILSAKQGSEEVAEEQG